MSAVHIPEEEAAKSLGPILSRVREGDEIVIDGQSISVRLVPMELPEGRTVTEMTAILKQLPGERGVMDEDFARDLANFRRRHPESLDGSKWD